MVLILTPLIYATDAVYNSTLGAPYCENEESPCIAGSNLLKDVGTGITTETNYPNTVDSCIDGNSGAYLNDESVENITLTDLNRDNFTAGDLVEAKVVVYCDASASMDNINFVYANDSSNLLWRVVDYQDPCPAGGFQTITKNFVLDDVEGNHVFRTIIQFSGDTSTTCGVGEYDDNDDKPSLIIVVGSRNENIKVPITENSQLQKLLDKHRAVNRIDNIVLARKVKSQ